MQKLIQIVVPLEDNNGVSLAAERNNWERVLTSQFGGLTIFHGASGLWSPGYGRGIVSEDVQIWMIHDSDYSPTYWQYIKRCMTFAFRQEEMFIVVVDCERI